MSQSTLSEARHLDDADRRLITLLRAYARLPVSELANRAHVSRANAYVRLDRLRREGLIRGYTGATPPSWTTTRWDAVCRPSSTYGSDSTPGSRFASGCWLSPRSSTWALVSGEFDVVLLIRTRDARSLRTLVLEELQTMPEVITTQTAFILNEASADRPL